MEDPIQCRCCSKNAVVSWASNLNPEDNWDLSEGCQVVEFEGWPKKRQLSTAIPPAAKRQQKRKRLAIAIVPAPESFLFSIIKYLAVRDNDAAPVASVTSPTPPTALLDTQVEQLVVSSAVSPPDIEDPEPILCRNVDCYVSGLLASFRRETLILVVHEILILYPQSEYAIEKERPILHQRYGGEPGKVGCMYLYHIQVEAYQRSTLHLW